MRLASLGAGKNFNHNHPHKLIYINNTSKPNSKPHTSNHSSICNNHT